MHTTFGCACLLTDKFVVVADVFFRKDDGEGCSAALSQSVRKPPCLDNRQRHSFDDQRLTVFIGDTCHLAHNGPEALGNRLVVLGRETGKLVLPDLIRPILSRSRDTTLAPVSLARRLANVVLPACEAP